MKSLNIFALLAAVLLAFSVATAEEEGDVATAAESKTTEAEATVTEEELAEEEEDQASELEMMDQTERGLFQTCRQSCDLMTRRCVRLPFFRSSLAGMPATVRFRCITRRLIQPIIKCRKTCFNTFGYFMPKCVRRCIIRPGMMVKNVKTVTQLL